MQHMQFFRTRMIYEYYLGIEIMSIFGMALFFNYFLHFDKLYHILFVAVYAVYVITRAAHFVYKIYFLEVDESYQPPLGLMFVDGIFLFAFLFIAGEYFHILSPLLYIYLVLLSILFNHKHIAACTTYVAAGYMTLISLRDYKALASLEVITYVLIIYLLGYIMSSLIKEISKLENRMFYMYEDLENKNFLLSEMVSKDFLTNLYNHKTFYLHYKELAEGSDEPEKIFSLAMLDIDDFKKVNDTYGHLTGDRILQEVSMLIMANIRKNDIAARYGGEEFAIIFPGTTPESGTEVCERIRKVVEGHVFDQHNQGVRITISGGVAGGSLIEPHQSKQNKLLESADQLLYMAKSQGKNKILFSQELIMISE